MRVDSLEKRSGAAKPAKPNINTGSAETTPYVAYDTESVSRRDSATGPTHVTGARIRRMLKTSADAISTDILFMKVTFAYDCMYSKTLRACVSKTRSNSSKSTNSSGAPINPPSQPQLKEGTP